MSVASSQQSFLTNALTPTCRPNRWPIPIRLNSIAAVPCKCQSHSDDPKHPSSSSRICANLRLEKLAMVALAAGLLTIGSVDPAFAAKSGGRVGGQAFRSSAPPPRSSAPRINNSSDDWHAYCEVIKNPAKYGIQQRFEACCGTSGAPYIFDYFSTCGAPASTTCQDVSVYINWDGLHCIRTNIYVNPPVAPPLVGGFGYGYGVPFYGGWGWSPFSFFAPGPSVAIGVGGGFDTIVLFMFLGAAAAVVRRIFGSRETDDDDY